MIRHILYPILGSSSVETGLTTALQVAEKFGGHVETICCRREFTSDAMMIAEEVNLEEFTEMAHKFDQDEKRRLSHARHAFDAVRETRGVRYEQHPGPNDGLTASWENVTGNPYDAIAQRAGATDLVVVGRTEEGIGPLTRGMAETALFGCGAPLLLAAEAPGKTLGRTVLIGWNRSAPSARSVRAAMPLLRSAEKAEILMVATGAKTGTAPERLAEHLALHGVSIEVKEIPPDYRKVSEVLVEEAGEIGADLLIMGAFSHSRLREVVLGGVTRDIMGEGSLPVLMTH